MENRESSIEKLTADAFLQRLGKSMDKFEVMLEDREYKLALCRAKIQKALMQNNLDEAERLIDFYKEQDEMNNALHYQFLVLVRAELWRKKEMPIPNQKKNIIEGLSKMIPEFYDSITPDILSNKRFCILELFLLERYAMILEQEENVEEARVWYNEILNYVDRIPFDKAEKGKIYPFAAYRLACCEKVKGNIQSAQKVIENVIEIMCDNNIAVNQTGLYLCI